MNNNWQFRISLLVCALGLVGIGIFSWIKAPPPPPPHGEFIRQIKADYPNPQGDQVFLCQTDYCNPTDRFIGMSTGLVYINFGAMHAGVPSGKAKLTSYLPRVKPQAWQSPQMPHARR